MQIYLVGGAVRDKLLGIPIKDRDWVVTGSTHEEMLAKGFKSVGNDFPVYLHPESHEEYALARTERKSGHGYAGFICDFNPNVTLKEDLSRRDLTINAIAEDEQGQIHDPYKGKQDIDSQLLRHVSPAFSEDPLRVLRVARFHARLQPLGFKVERGTLDLMRDISRSGELQHLTAERVWQELNRALDEPCPMAFFKTLQECEALPLLFPELADHFTNSNSRLEALANVSHALSTADNRANTLPMLRWAALFFAMKIEQAKAQCSRLKAPNQFKKLALSVAKHAEKIILTNPITPESILSIYEAEDAFRQSDRLYNLIVICKAFALESDLPRLDRYTDLLPPCKALPVQPLLEQGIKGKELGSAIRQQRLDFLTAALNR